MCDMGEDVNVIGLQIMVCKIEIIQGYKQGCCED